MFIPKRYHLLNATCSKHPFLLTKQCFGLILPFVFLVFQSSVFAQDIPSNLHTKKISSPQLKQLIDTLIVLPQSVQVIESDSRMPVDSSLFSIENNYLIWKNQEAIPNEAINIQYRTLPEYFTTKEQHLDTLKIAKNPDNADYVGFEYEPYKADENKIFGNENLNYNGSLSRGISFGNAQNVVLNSDFNLQMSGVLGDGVEIKAAISDSNIPLQAEGNTQNLSDFDKVYITLKKDNHQLTAGDYELTPPKSYFLNYYKKLQGATYQNLTEFGNGATLNSNTSVALSRGQYARNSFLAQEGNQGPYRLRGNEGERFIIILSGTEKVYLDGELLKRGIEYDYVIDYNRGDITFMPKRLITKDKRIVIDFEYATQNYLRSIYTANTEFNNDKWNIYFNLYSEQDSKNTSGLSELDTEEKRLLADAGDQREGVFSNSVRQAGEEEANPIRYIYKDTLVDGIVYDSVLVYSTSSAASLVVQFTEVGANKGFYRRLPSAANGTVFEWIAPDENGILQGDYAPVVRLSAPILQQVYTLGANYKISKNSNLRTEIALSNKDFNRFSTINNDDNFGAALFTQYRIDIPLSKKDSVWNLTTGIDYEYRHQNFKEINPYRAAEFVRDWNINDLETRQEQIARGVITLKNKKNGRLHYELSAYQRGELYTGIRHFNVLEWERNGFRIFGRSNILNTDGINERTKFIRPNLDISKTFTNWNNFKIGVYGEREQNEIYHQSDTLAATSFLYDVYKAYAKTDETKPFFVGLSYQQRYDYSPQQSTFEEITKADELAIDGQWKQSRNSLLRWNIAYRNLDITNQKLTNEQALKTILGRLEYSFALWKGSFRSNTTYELGSGQEPRLEYNYLQVLPGEGVYQWNDYNQDSLQQINEFEIAVNPDQAQYIRVSILTNDFIRTDNVTFNQSLSINPKAIWYDQKGYKKILSLFATQTNIKILRRNRAAPEVQVWNPFQSSVSDTSLIAASSTIRNTLFFNRTNPKYDMQLGMANTQNKVVLTTGFEDRTTAEQFYRARWNIFGDFTLNLSLEKAERANNSELFDQRDYQIESRILAPSLTWLIAENVSTTIKYNWEDSKNTLPNAGETALKNSFGLSVIINKSATTSFDLDFTYSDIQYNGTRNTPVEYAILESLQPGKNYLWNLGWNRQLGKSLQLNISYEGRKTGDLNIVHIGRTQVRANF